MGLDDFVKDPEKFSGYLEVGDVPSLKTNTPPGEYLRWRNYEPSEYEDSDDEENKVTAVVGDCNIEGSDRAKMMVIGPEDCSEEQLIKSDYFVALEDLTE